VAPDLPTIAESGLPGFNEGGQHGIVAPGGTARALLDRLHQELAKAMHAPEVKTRVQAEGGRIVASTPDEYRSLIRSEMQKWTKVIAAAGISPL
jgi:tripartite-type tricarboxylate transporter receptor subunit TctC